MIKNNGYSITSLKQKNRWTGMFAVVVLLVVALLSLIWRAIDIDKELSIQRSQLITQITIDAGIAITSKLDELQHEINSLADGSNDLLQSLAASPNNTRAYDTLRQRLTQTFPNALAFTLANADGDPLVADFIGLLSEVCLNNIQNFSSSNETSSLMIHPTPQGDHIDLMHTVELEGAGKGILFVSINTEILEIILADHRLLGYELLLESRDSPGLIEVSAEEARNVVKSDIRLSADEQLRIAYRHSLEGTPWNVIAIKRSSSAGTSSYQLWLQTSLAIGILSILGFTALFIIRRSYMTIESAALHIDKQHQRLKAILETVAESIVTIDERGVIQSFNSAAERTFRYKASDVIGKNVHILMPEPYRSEHDGYLNHYLSTGEKRVIGIGREVVGQKSDGSTFPMQLAVTETLLGSQRLFTAAIHDISEKKKIDQMKNEFISIVSHELRTPLTSIRGSLGLIAGGAAGELSAQAKQLIDIASNNSERLVQMINDILDIEKIESGKMRFEIKPQRLLPVIKQAIESSRGFAKQYDVNIVLAANAADLSAKFDANRITQVVVNLLSNAVKFTPRGGLVQITIEQADGHARVNVIDQGPGIPEAFRDRIFAKFAQADSSDGRQKSGSGLGLSICKAIIQEHSGTIGFDSQPDQGSIFYFALPATRSAMKDVSLQQEQALPSPHSHILICEDDPDIATLIKLMLEQSNYQIDIAYDVPQARKMIAKKNYDAITMDLALPGESGLDFIRELQGKDSTQALPIIVISATAEQGKQKLAGSAIGVVDWLNKPIDNHRLMEAIQQATGVKVPKILHVEDDQDIAEVVAHILGQECDVHHADSLQTAQEWIRREQFDLIILDLTLPDGSGLNLLPILNSTENPPPVLVFSASELSADVAREVSATLIKSQTDNFMLVKTINTLLATKGGNDRKP